MSETQPLISVVVPLYNEEGNLALLHQKLTESLTAFGQPYELIFVNDGSTDNSVAILQDIVQQDACMTIIDFQQNFGKTAGLTAGFQYSRGELIITIDADLQDDPAEIPKLVTKLDEGYDVVGAWRFDRNDPVDKTLPSRIFNWVVANFTGLRLHDFNCGFKVYRRQVTQQIKLYSDFHRFIPVLAYNRGFRITEVPVQHHPRHSGVSKYGAGRTIRGLLDFIAVLFLMTYLKNPLRLFGTGGLIMLAIGTVIEFYLAILWLLRELGISETGAIGTRPLFLVGILAMILGIQLFSTGLLGEMLRYFTFKPDQEYVIDKIITKDNATG